MKPILAFVMVSCVAIAVSQNDGMAQSTCRPAGKVSFVRELKEGSGIAASRSHPGVLWAHNDSAAPVLVALDEHGTVVSQVRVPGAQVDDWEDIAVGPCPRGSCIYIGDIGDNTGARRQVTIYRVPEPAPSATTTEPAEAFHARYPDGPHDAESLFVTASSEIFVVTKGDPGPIALYRLPALAAGNVLQLERVGAPTAGGKSKANDRPTAADISADGRWVAVRTSDYVAFFAANDFVVGRWSEAFRADVRELREPQGEGVTFGRDGAVFLLGEGTARGGTFARLDCTLK
jgi:hypothetical protein